MAAADVDRRAFQELREGNHCWGCGPANPDGLQLRSYWSGDESVATWVPSAEHAAGPLHVLNGGIIATLLDCHAVATAGADAVRESGHDSDWFATGQLSVRYLRPTPIGDAVHLRGAVVARNGRTTTVDCTLSCAGEVTATATVTAVRVPPSWVAGP